MRGSVFFSKWGGEKMNRVDCKKSFVFLVLCPQNELGLTLRKDLKLKQLMIVIID